MPTNVIFSKNKPFQQNSQGCNKQYHDDFQALDISIKHNKKLHI